LSVHDRERGQQESAHSARKRVRAHNQFLEALARLSCWESSCQVVVEQHQGREGRHREDLARNRLARSESCRISERAQVHLQSISLSLSLAARHTPIKLFPDSLISIDQSRGVRRAPHARASDPIGNVHHLLEARERRKR